MISGRAVYATTLAALLIGSGLAVALSPAGVPLERPTAAAGAFRTTDDGTRYTVDPDLLRQGCPGGLDCIPSIDDPRFQPAEAAVWLSPADRVIGVEIDGEARAYPLRILNVHEVVNDRLAGRPIAVTYCPLCRSGFVFSRGVEGATLTFGVSGKLLEANLVLYDRETETYWSQLRGEAIVGPLVPTSLAVLPSTITTWGDWRRSHPTTSVLSRDTGIYPKSTYGSNPYAGYANSSGVGFGVGTVDDRLDAKALVYGVTVGENSTAYPASILEPGETVNDRVGGLPVLVVTAPDGGVRAYSRRVADRPLRFRPGEGALVDQHGHRWSYDGVALSGPREGDRLERVGVHGVYWFAWSRFHPDTGLYTETAAADSSGKG